MLSLFVFPLYSTIPSTVYGHISIILIELSLSQLYVYQLHGACEGVDPLNSDGDEDADGKLSRQVQRVKPSDSPFQLQRKLSMDFQCQVWQAQGDAKYKDQNGSDPSVLC